MFWFFYNYYPKHPHHKKIWVKIRFLHDTDKAILVYYNGKKIWIPKSRAYKIKFRKRVFVIYAKESLVA